MGADLGRVAGRLGASSWRYADGRAIRACDRGGGRDARHVKPTALRYSESEPALLCTHGEVCARYMRGGQQLWYKKPH